MSLTFTYKFGDETSTATWTDGVVDDEFLQVVCDFIVETRDEVEIWWGMWFGTPTLDTPEGAWGTMRDALLLLGAELIDTPEPPFQPPFEDGEVY